MRNSKAQRILAAFRKGRRLSPVDGFVIFNTTRLGGIVYSLKKQGWNIKTRIKESTASGRVVHYAEYYLGRPHRVQ